MTILWVQVTICLTFYSIPHCLPFPEIFFHSLVTVIVSLQNLSWTFQYDQAFDKIALISHIYHEKKMTDHVMRKVVLVRRKICPSLTQTYHIFGVAIENAWEVIFDQMTDFSDSPVNKYMLSR